MYKFTVSPYFVILDSVFYFKKCTTSFLVETVIFCKHIANRKIFFQHCSPPPQVPTNPFAGKCVLMFYIIYVNGVPVLGVEQCWKAKNVAPKPEPNNAKWHNYPIWKQIDRK